MLNNICQVKKIKFHFWQPRRLKTCKRGDGGECEDKLRECDKSLSSLSAFIYRRCKTLLPPPCNCTLVLCLELLKALF